LFNYPFTVSKKIIETFEAKPDATQYWRNEIYLKKTFICLEKSLADSLKLEKYVIEAYKIISRFFFKPPKNTDEF
jgi:hypothetical protein